MCPAVYPLAASPFRARQAPRAADGDEDGAIPSNASQIEGEGELDEDDRALAEPVLTIADVRDSDLDMSECVSKILEGLQFDTFTIARDIRLKRLQGPDGFTPRRRSVTVNY